MRIGIEKLAWLIDQHVHDPETITIGNLAKIHGETSERIMDAIDVLKIRRGQSTQLPPVPWGHPFSPLQPGVLKFTMSALAERWPHWDDDADNDIDRAHGEPWPEREVVAAVVLRALSDAGFATGVLRSDYVCHPEGESDS